MEETFDDLIPEVEGMIRQDEGVDTSTAPFSLPSLSSSTFYPHPFSLSSLATTPLSSLIDRAPILALEGCGMVNWMKNTQNSGGGEGGEGGGEVEEEEEAEVTSLLSENDGNCLCHSASLLMWGCHDRNLTLRDAIRR